MPVTATSVTPSALDAIALQSSTPEVFRWIQGVQVGSAAVTMYWLARWAGRPLVLRYGKFARVPPAKLEQAERWAARFGSFGIFASRMLPVIRHLISIPAGLIGMGFTKFSVLTLVGSAIWCSVLAALGQKVGNQLDPQQLAALRKGEGVDLVLLIHSVKHEALWITLTAGVVCILYFVAMRLTKAKTLP